MSPLMPEPVAADGESGPVLVVSSVLLQPLMAATMTATQITARMGRDNLAMRLDLMS
jgi:hypothetical protein